MQGLQVFVFLDINEDDPWGEGGKIFQHHLEWRLARGEQVEHIPKCRQLLFRPPVRRDEGNVRRRFEGVSCAKVPLAVLLESSYFFLDFLIRHYGYEVQAHCKTI